ncbi:MAG: hypothetical protein K9N51_09350 [Candidatus Pacebacteria bacterium]|nr:hypothetical protein [Candidatus Paceibacterota bacterium]
MIEHNDNCITVGHDTLGWTAHHDAGSFGGRFSMELANDRLCEDGGFYVDDMTVAHAVVDHANAYRKSGTAVVESRAHLPFGNGVELAQACRYAANHVSVTLDIQWRRGVSVNRHLGVNAMWLPGRWSRYYCLPPAVQWADGIEPAWHELPEVNEGETMAGHWHRPPLCLVFERPDGKCLEIGTGSDLWRWEQCLGAGPDKGSYKIQVQPDGIRLIWEPLMCCEPYDPPPRQYRMKWYMAWDNGEAPRPPAPAGKSRTVEMGADRKLKIPEQGEAGQYWVLDMTRLQWPETAYRTGSAPAYIRGERSSLPCAEGNATRKLLKRVVRQLADRAEPGILEWRGLTLGPCWDSSHVNRKNRDGTVHWDISTMLEFGTWARRQLGPAWDIRVANDLANVLPSLAGLFQPTAF